MEHIQTTTQERLNTVARGATAGIIAGTIFGLGEIAAAGLTGYGAAFPVKMAASVWLAHTAFTMPTLPVLLFGLSIHYGIAILWGMVAAALYEWTDWSRKMHLSVAPMVAIGAVFGMFVWMIDLAMVAGNFLPWIWRAHQPAQFLLHVVFFGVPLGASVAGIAVASPSPPDVAYVEAKR